MKNAYQKNIDLPSSKFFLIISLLFIVCLLSANIVATKLISVFGLFFPAGIIIFPVSYIVNDVLTEVYGYQKAKMVIWLAFLCNLVMVCIITIAQFLPPAPFWVNQKAYEQILGTTPRILLASFTAFLVGSFTNSIVLSKMKLFTRGKFLWSRTIGSTIVGEGLDTLVFITIAFLGTVPDLLITNMVFSQWMFKSLYEIVMTPITYVVIDTLKLKEKTDHYDKDTSYNPFLLK